MSAPLRVVKTEPAASWPLEALASALGGSLKETKPGVWALTITNEVLGTQLSLELAPEHGAVRLSVDRDRRTPPWAVGRVDLFGVATVEVDRQGRQAAFRAAGAPGQELLVTHLAQFRLVVGIEPARVSPVPPAVKEDEPELTVTGRLARPRYLEPGGRPFWSAGLAESVADQDEPVWHSVKAWGSLAQAARELPKGCLVTVTGKQKEERYLKDGEPRLSAVLVLSAIDPA